jgi:hypothetical protein
METLNTQTLEGFVTYTAANKLYLRFLEQYETKIQSVPPSEAETFMKRLEVMAYRQTLYKQQKVPPEIAQYYPKVETRRYANFKNM